MFAGGVYVAAVPLADRVPTLPGASDQVTEEFAVSVTGVASRATGAAGVITGPVDAPAAVPVPDKLIVCGDPAPLSVMVKVADSAAVVDGVNVIAMVQLAPTAKLVPQLFPWIKSAAFVPLKLTPAIVREPVPVFESTTGCAGLVVETVWLPKLIEFGLGDPIPFPVGDPPLPPEGAALSAVQTLTAVQP